MDDVLTHELIHAFDHCRAHVDWGNLDHLACSEVKLWITYVTGPAKINHISAKIVCFCSHNLQTIYANKKSVTTVEFNGLSAVIHENGIPHSELKILAKI